MKAQLLKKCAPIESSPLLLEEYPCPEPSEKEVLVRVKACGICRTDLHVIEGELPARALPLIPGHQVVGEIVAVGKRCTKFTTGQRVGIPWLQSTCGQCQYCQGGSENFCDASQYTGFHKNGGFAEYVSAFEDYVYEIPDYLDDIHAAPLLCAGIIGYRALKKASLPKAGRLGLIGFGSSAHLTMQIAQAEGTRCYVFSRGSAHQAFAKSLGAHWCGETFESSPEELDSIIVFAPRGEIIPHALKMLKKGGTVVTAGIYMSDIPPMEYRSCIFHEKILVSVEANTRQDGIELFQKAKENKILPHAIPFRFEEANQALQQLKRDGFQGTGVLIFSR